MKNKHFYFICFVVSACLLGLGFCTDSPEESYYKALIDSELDDVELDNVKRAFFQYCVSQGVSQEDAVTIKRLAELGYVQPALGEGGVKDYTIHRGSDGQLVIIANQENQKPE